MEYIDLLASKSVHGLVMTAFILLAIYEPVRELVPAANYLVAIGIIIAWLLGTRFERELLIRSGVLDREAADRAERDVRPV